MDEPFLLALTYDDVLLVPRRSGVRSRRDVDTGTRLTRRIPLAIPIVGANMDTVTEAAMAIALARMAASASSTASCRSPARRPRSPPSSAARPGGRPALDAAADGQRRRGARPDGRARRRRPAGRRGGRAARRAGRPATSVRARPGRAGDDADDAARPLITAPAHTDLPTAQALLDRHRLEKLPLVDADGRLAGLITGKDIAASLRFPQRDQGRARPAARRRGHRRRRRLPGAGGGAGRGVDALVLDIAHGPPSTRCGRSRRSGRAPATST